MSLAARATAPLLLAFSLHAQTYIDSARCRDCHREIADRYAQTGMARTFATVTDTSEFQGLQFRHEASGDKFTAVIQNGTASLRREQGASALEKRIEFRFGSGEHSKSYFGRDAQGKLIEMPVSWYSESGGTWAMSPGFDSAQHAGFSRRVNPQCMFCHTAYSQTQSIDCQRCHGPGSNHIANPTKATIFNAKKSMDVCLQCHLETTNLALPGEIVRYDRDVFSYKPNEPLTDYALYFDHKPGTGYDDKFEFSSAPYRLFQSACYRSNPAAITCTTCHDPHGGDRSPAAYAKICNTCHAGKIAATHPAGEDCVACHMAVRRPSDAVHVTIRDHKISRRPIQTPPGPIAETNGLNMPPYRGEVVPYYPADATQAREGPLYLAMAQVRNSANLTGGIPALEAALARFKPASAEPWLDLGDAYRRTKNPKAIAAYREAVRLAPANWRTQFGLALALNDAGQPQQALTALARALEAAPEEARIYETAAQIRSAAGQLKEAIATLRAGLKTAPDSAELHNNLGTTLLRTGNTLEAETAFQEALRLRPELAALHLNMASLLARTNRIQEAKVELETALKLNPNLANAEKNLDEVMRRLRLTPN